LWDRVDTDQSGELDADEVTRLVRSLPASCGDVQGKEADAWLRTMDRDGDGMTRVALAVESGLSKYLVFY
jgi:hypothetical protein